MPTTSNFGWTTPADTDLVKDGALAIRTLGNGIDTSLVDLKGGTTGQILSKASNTDLDYTWINNDVGDITDVAVTSPITGGGSSGSVTIGIQDGTTVQKGAVQLENSISSTSTTTAAVPASVKSAYDLANAAIPKSLVDAAGDLIYATANDTVARLGIGAAGRVLKVNSGATAPEWAIDPTTDVVTTAGDLIYGTGADAVTRLGIGTAGQVLRVNSGATAPEWATASTGSFVFISRTTFSNVASQAFDNVFSSTYQKYLVVLDNMSAATSNDDPELQFRYAGPTTQTTTYYSGVEQIGWVGANTLTQVNNGSAIKMSTNTGDSSTSGFGSAYLFFTNVGLSAKPTVIINYVSGQLNVNNGFGANDTTRTYTGFLLKSSSTNITGTATVYGLANS